MSKKLPARRPLGALTGPWAALAARLAGDAHEAVRLQRLLSARPSRAMTDVVKSLPTELGIVQVLVRALTADLSVEQLRDHVRQLSPWVLRSVNAAAKQRRQRPKSQQGGRTRGRKRRATQQHDAQSIPEAIEAIKREGRATSDPAAARLYLARRHPKTWPVLDGTEREKRVEAFVRRLSTLRKKRRSEAG